MLSSCCRSCFKQLSVVQLWAKVVGMEMPGDDSRKLVRTAQPSETAEQRTAHIPDHDLRNAAIEKIEQARAKMEQTVDESRDRHI